MNYMLFFGNPKVWMFTFWNHQIGLFWTSGLNQAYPPFQKHAYPYAYIKIILKISISFWLLLMFILKFTLIFMLTSKLSSRLSSKSSKGFSSKSQEGWRILHFLLHFKTYLLTLKYWNKKRIFKKNSNSSTFLLILGIYRKLGNH